MFLLSWLSLYLETGVNGVHALFVYLFVYGTCVCLCYQADDRIMFVCLLVYLHVCLLVCLQKQQEQQKAKQEKQEKQQLKKQPVSVSVVKKPVVAVSILYL